MFCVVVGVGVVAFGVGVASCGVEALAFGLDVVAFGVDVVAFGVGVVVFGVVGSNVCAASTHRGASDQVDADVGVCGDASLDSHVTAAVCFCSDDLSVEAADEFVGDGSLENDCCCC